MRIKRFVVAAAAAVLVAAGWIATAPSGAAAQAAATCQIFQTAYDIHQAGYFCVGVSNAVGAAGGYAYTTDVTQLQPGSRGTIVVYVQQCDGYGHNCGTISANRAIAATWVDTSGKQTSFGHVYKACGSFQGSGVTVGPICSPPVSA
jgi:hypothetical protein